jgi:Omp85 superfamily domain
MVKIPARLRRLVISTLAISLFAAPAVAQLTTQKGGKPDPFDGMDRNGRIPKVQLPAHIKHPERWRYFPEGRLVKGSMLDRFLISSFFSPILFREKDVGTGGGVAITDVDFRNQRRQEFANIHVTSSSEGQQTFRVNWRRWTNHIELPDGGVAQDERSFVHFNGGYTKSLTSRFFGLGPNRKKSAESSYTRERSAVELFYQFTEPDPADNLILHIGAELEHNNLSSGQVKSVANTRTAYASAFNSGEDRDIFWVDLRARYDTRDSIHNAYSGWYAGGSARTALLQTGGDVGAIFSGYASKIFAVPPLFHEGGDDEEENPPTDTLAIGATTSVTSGKIPFYSLPSLGGSRTLRGYINNRWTDRAAWHASAEYRFWFIPRGVALTDWVRIERVGAALFYELGNVGPSFDALFDDKAKYSYGVSLRFSLERTALFRVDYGISNEDNNLSIAYGLTF